MKFRPLGERCLVKKIKLEEPKKGSLIIPDSAKKEEDWAEVIYLGEDGNVKMGDIILLPKYAGAPVQLDGEEFIIINNADILGVIE